MTAVVDLDPSFDPFRPDNFSAPYPFYSRLREIGPVLYLPSRKVYLATTHEAVNTALRDFRTFSSAAGAGYPICSASQDGGIQRTKVLSAALIRAPRLTGRLTRFTMDRVGGWLMRRDPDPVAAPFIGTDPPQHTLNRRAVQPFFRKDAIQDAAPMVRGHVTELVDRALSCMTIDAVGAFSAELPARVISPMPGRTTGPVGGCDASRSAGCPGEKDPPTVTRCAKHELDHTRISNPSTDVGPRITASVFARSRTK